METIFDSEQIRAIQTDELSEIKGMTIEQIATRMDSMQKASAEIMLRYRKDAEEMHRRLRERSDSELEAIVQRVPEGVSGTAFRMAQQAKLNQSGYVVKESKRKPSAEDRLRAKFDAAAKSNPAIAAMLETLKAK
jgi:DNA-binding transcriptional MerR regulator